MAHLSCPPLCTSLACAPDLLPYVHLPDNVPSLVSRRCWHPCRGSRIGEAKQPGPDKRAATEQDPHEDAEMMHMQTRRRLLQKGPDHLPPIPDDAELDDLTDAVDTSPMGLAPARVEPAANPRTLLKMMVSRAQGPPVLLILSAAWISGKRSWRWQIRAAPALSGTERAHPAESLAAFLQRHRDALSDEAGALIHARIVQLQEHDAPVYAPRRIRSDPQRYAVPAAPLENHAAPRVGQRCRP